MAIPAPMGALPKEKPLGERPKGRCVYAALRAVTRGSSGKPSFRLSS